MLAYLEKGWSKRWRRVAKFRMGNKMKDG